MANQIQVKRGLKSNLPTLSSGEFGYCTDSKELYMGNTTGGNTKVILESDSGSSAGASSYSLGKYSLAQSDNAVVNGYNNVVNATTGINAFPVNNTTFLSGLQTGVKGGYAGGFDSLTTGNLGYTYGVSCVSSNDCARATGYFTTSSGKYSSANNRETTASGYCSTSFGLKTTSSIFGSFVTGQWNKVLTGNATTYSGTADSFVIGNGTGSSTLSNAFRVTFAGATYGLSAFNSTGADYAEYFEWLDGNTNAEDRVGYFVTLDGDKIRKATSTDTYIIGIVSAFPSVIGDSYDDWHGKYLRDEWGRIQYHQVVVLDEDQQETVETHPIYNPDWNPQQEYISREHRPEWSAVGMMGKLLVRDDGTCQVNGYCKSNDDGIATNADNGYRVIARISDNIVKVIIK